MNNSGSAPFAWLHFPSRDGESPQMHLSRQREKSRLWDGLSWARRHNISRQTTGWWIGYVRELGHTYLKSCIKAKAI